MKSYMAKAETFERRWVAVDANGLVLGRLAVEIAMRLMGKHRPQYTPHCDTGDFVVVTNCEKVVITGQKKQQSTHATYSGYPGGLRTETLGSLLERHPERVLRLAVKRMLPKTRLGRAMLKKLKIFAGAEHPHAAQQPIDVTEQLAHTRR